jgi:quinol monooxygenase YgiN
MAMLFVRHKVGDYAKWKRVYDDFAPTRRELGVKGAAVYRDPDDSKTLVVWHRFDDIRDAAAFAKSEELKSTMAKAGVIGAPVLWFGEDIEETPY